MKKQREKAKTSSVDILGQQQSMEGRDALHNKLQQQKIKKDLKQHRLHR